ncbi:flagellar motor switch protein FliM [Agromyces soli]|uniref:Flagellar motor switch protein FliM n=1 Tax=Agromyces soli TaxID=659012 RepID=A0ABY4AVX1_9MICO|nr:flagellar motor switch protein FliM [Agromyces soli]UOE27309.1 flagellar motor switch protein FliM [Agromyces soli]
MLTRTEEQAETPTRAAEPYDFRRPTTLAREHSRVLELAFESFARQWGTQLTANVRARSQATFLQVGMHTYDDYAASLPPATTMVLCRLAGDEAKAVIQFPASAALGWMTHMLGGSGERIEPERTFTEIEQQLLRALLDDLLDDLQYSLGRVLPARPEFDSLHHTAQFAQAAPTSALMIVASFIVECAERETTATLALPADAVLRGLGESNPVVATDRARSLVAAQIELTPVPLGVGLAPVPVTPHDILELAVGDVIPLAHAASEPFLVTVDGRAVGRAAIGRTGNRLACTITETLEIL